MWSQSLLFSLDWPCAALVERALRQDPLHIFCSPKQCDHNPCCVALDGPCTLPKCGNVLRKTLSTFFCSFKQCDHNLWCLVLADSCTDSHVECLLCRTLYGFFSSLEQCDHNLWCFVLDDSCTEPYVRALCRTLFSPFGLSSKVITISVVLLWMDLAQPACGEPLCKTMYTFFCFLKYSDHCQTCQTLSLLLCSEYSLHAMSRALAQNPLLMMWHPMTRIRSSRHKPPSSIGGGQRGVWFKGGLHWPFALPDSFGRHGFQRLRFELPGGSTKPLFSCKQKILIWDRFSMRKINHMFSTCMDFARLPQDPPVVLAFLVETLKERRRLKNVIVAKNPPFSCV